MPDDRPMWPDPSPGAGMGKLDTLLANREAHQEQMREELELEHEAREGEARRRGLRERIRDLLRR